MNAPRIAVVGASLELGSDIVALLLDRGIDLDRIHVLDREATAGETLEVGTFRRRIEWASREAMGLVDFALFCGSEEVASELVPAVAAAGGVSIDATAHSRGAAGARLVVPELNAERVGRIDRGAVLASPAPAAIGLALALAPLHRAATVRRVVATVLEPASQRGAAGVEDLSRQSIQLMRGEGIDHTDVPEQLAFNLRAQAPAPDADGWSACECALAREVVALLDAPAIEVAATVVRAPVFYGTAAAVHLDLERALDIAEAEVAIREGRGLLLAGSVEDRLALAVETTRRRKELARAASGHLDEGDEWAEDEELEEDGLEELEGEEEGREEDEEGWREEDEDDVEEGEEERRWGARAARGRGEAEPPPDLLPGPVEVSGSEFVHVARLRVDRQRPTSLACWIAFDEIRRGVALNLVSILELALRAPL